MAQADDLNSIDHKSVDPEAKEKSHPVRKKRKIRFDSKHRNFYKKIHV